MSLDAHFILFYLRTTLIRHLMVFGSFVIGFCGLPRVILASQAAPVYVNKNPSRLTFSHDLLVQMTDHSLILWNSTTWKKQGEVQLGSGDFNTALGVGLLANGDFIGLGYRGIEPPYQIHILSEVSPKSLKRELFLPAPYTTWGDWRIFPDIGHPRQFWVASPDGVIPLSRYSLPPGSEKQAVLSIALINVRFS